jgi:hypothetical protein
MTPTLASIERLAADMRACYDHLPSNVQASMIEVAHSLAQVRVEMIDDHAGKIIKLHDELRQGQGLLPGIRV